MLERRIESIEEWCLEHEACDDVLAGDGQNMRLARFGMERRVVAHALRIGFGQLAHIGGQLAVIGVHRFPYVHQMDEVVGFGGVDPIGRGQRSARGEQDLLNGAKIVLAMREAESESNVGVGMAEDMRYTEYA